MDSVIKDLLIISGEILWVLGEKISEELSEGMNPSNIFEEIL